MPREITRGREEPHTGVAIDCNYDTVSVGHRTIPGCKVTQPSGTLDALHRNSVPAYGSETSLDAEIRTRAFVDEQLTTPFQRVADLLRRKREERGFSGPQLGTMVGVDKAVISDFERGKRDPRRSHVFPALIKALGVSPDELFEAFIEAPSRGVGRPGFREGDTFVQAAELRGLTPIPVYRQGEERAMIEGVADIVMALPLKPRRGRVIGILMKDNAMLPYLEAGDVALVDLGHKPHVGDRVLVSYEDRGLQVRNYLGRNGDQLVLRGEGDSALEVAPPEVKMLGALTGRCKA